MCEGIALELKGIDLGDKRLNRRSEELIEALARDPQASINASCETWADTHAAYRFFSNERVTPEAILAPHRAATLARAQEHALVVIAQDTTEIDLTPHPPSDAQILDAVYRYGFYDHTYLATTPDGLVLGVIGGEEFGRTPETLGKANERATLPIEEKESMRWLTGYRAANQAAAECPNTRIVSVGDRDADIYDVLLEEASQRTQPGAHAEILIRARVDRRLTERDIVAGGANFLSVRKTVEQSPLLCSYVIVLPTTSKREGRRAVIELRAASVLVKPPHARPYLPAIQMQVVSAKEVGGPGDETDVDWLLFTSLPIDTIEHVRSVVQCYKSRWSIEVFFRTLKTGCKVEDIQLETISRYKNCLAFYKIIAARIMYLTHLNRISPDISCECAFAESEWKPVWRIVTKKQLPRKPPKLGEFIKLLASLGGYNNRPKEPPPGTQVIWIAMRRMLDFARAWLEFGPDAR